ncbi:unnamed protein product [Strongylus vulgaris]|uniref:Uncharacterized protein n=1 Tax=Strongylus vulgaris TaxID=40348 RepID=A0A3P7JHA8_STRVU|nr:unnamed protein product [Strongylus vulgaris]
MHTTITVNRDGSAVLTPSKNVRVSELMDETAPMNNNQAIIHPVENLFNAVLNASPRTPRISESPWRPSSRRLRLEEVDISTSQESNSIEVVSVASPRLKSVAPQAKISDIELGQERDMNAKDSTPTDHSLKDSSDLTHEDEEHTCNQISQIVSE